MSEKQSKKASLVEAMVNTFAGLVFSFAIQKALNYTYDVEMSNTVAAHFVFWFTVASVVRSYIIRRLWTNQWWRVLKAKWRYRKIDPEICCCGCMIGEGGDICYHGGCRSAKEYAIECERNN